MPNLIKFMSASEQANLKLDCARLAASIAVAGSLLKMARELHQWVVEEGAVQSEPEPSSTPTTG